MKPIKAKENFNVNGIYYEVGDVIEEKIPIATLNKLNEKGYIEPLTMKDLKQYEKELNKEVK